MGEKGSQSLNETCEMGGTGCLSCFISKESPPNTTTRMSATTRHCMCPNAGSAACVGKSPIHHPRRREVRDAIDIPKMCEMAPREHFAEAILTIDIGGGHF